MSMAARSLSMTLRITWGLGTSPRTKRIDYVRYKVLTAAGTVDAEEYNPDADTDEESGDE